jgi:hypothetical protein
LASTESQDWLLSGTNSKPHAEEEMTCCCFPQSPSKDSSFLSDIYKRIQAYIQVELSTHFFLPSFINDLEIEPDVAVSYDKLYPHLPPSLFYIGNSLKSFFFLSKIVFLTVYSTR